MPARLLSSVSRRQFLLGSSAAAGAVLLGGCGGNDSGGAATTTTGSDLSLVQFFGGFPMLAAGREVRAPFGVGDAEGPLPVDRTPEAMTVTLLGPTGDVVIEAIEVPRHAQGLPRGYYPLRFTVEDPGIYTGRSEIDGVALEMAIKVDAPGDVQVIQAGDELPPIETPTRDDARGVDPICTNDPVCPLHDVTVADASGDWPSPRAPRRDPRLLPVRDLRSGARRPPGGGR